MRMTKIVWKYGLDAAIGAAFYEDIVRSVFASLPPLELLKKFPEGYREWYAEHFAPYEEQNISNAGPYLEVSASLLLSTGPLDPYFDRRKAVFRLYTPTSGRCITVETAPYRFLDTVTVEFPESPDGEPGSITAAAEVVRGINGLWMNDRFSHQAVIEAFTLEGLAWDGEGYTTHVQPSLTELQGHSNEDGSYELCIAAELAP